MCDIAEFVFPSGEVIQFQRQMFGVTMGSVPSRVIDLLPPITLPSIIGRNGLQKEKILPPISSIIGDLKLRPVTSPSTSEEISSPMEVVIAKEKIPTFSKSDFEVYPFKNLLPSNVDQHALRGWNCFYAAKGKHKRSTQCQEYEIEYLILLENLTFANWRGQTPKPKPFQFQSHFCCKCQTVYQNRNFFLAHDC